MSDNSTATENKWRYQALARSVSLELQRRHGRQEYYFPEHVTQACDACGISEADRVYAIAMFVAPWESDGILQKLRSSKTTKEIRKFLAGQMIDGPSGSVDFDYYGFHDVGTPSDGIGGSGSGGLSGDGAEGLGGDGDWRKAEDVQGAAPNLRPPGRFDEGWSFADPALCVVFMASFLFSAGIVIYLTAWIAGVINSVIMTGYLRKHQPTMAARIAPPLLEKSIASDFRRLRYVVRRGYADSPDSAFVSRMDIHRRVSLLSGAIVVVGLIIGAVYFAFAWRYA